MKDRWTELCEQAVTEVDPHKFRALLSELSQMLDEETVPDDAPVSDSLSSLPIKMGDHPGTSDSRRPQSESLCRASSRS